MEDSKFSTCSCKKQISISQLNMRYENNVQALKDIDFSVAKGEFVTIVGPSGCGKSTLIRIIAGLIDNYVGDVCVAGMTETCNGEQPLALVFQEANLLPWRKVLDNVRLPLELAEVCKNVQMEKSLDVLDIVRLKDFAEAYPRELSGGMKMRVSLARALVTKPQLMLLDEPFAALDEITRQQLNEDLLRLWQQDKWTAIFVTHNISEAVFLSSRVVVMSDRPGRIIADIAIPFSYPRTPQLRTDVGFAQYVGKISSLLREGAYE